MLSRRDERCPNMTCMVSSAQLRQRRVSGPTNCLSCTCPCPCSLFLEGHTGNGEQVRAVEESGAHISTLCWIPTICHGPWFPQPMESVPNVSGGWVVFATGSSLYGQDQRGRGCTKGTQGVDLRCHGPSIPTAPACFTQFASTLLLVVSTAPPCAVDWRHTMYDIM